MSIRNIKSFISKCLHKRKCHFCGKAINAGEYFALFWPSGWNTSYYNTCTNCAMELALELKQLNTEKEIQNDKESKETTSNKT